MPVALAVRSAARALARTLATATRAPAIAVTNFFSLFYSLTFVFLNFATFYDVSMQLPEVCVLTRVVCIGIGIVSKVCECECEC